MTYQDLHVSLYQGSCRDMSELPDNHVHCVVTSPPYFGLRKYDAPEEVWDGDALCEHEWGTRLKDTRHDHTWATSSPIENRPPTQYEEVVKGQYCKLCGAWRGQLGNEPSPELYVKHMVEICREIRRVLRKDGVCWINIGDSMATGKGTCFNPGGGKNSLEGHAKLKEREAYPLNRGNKSDLEAQGMKPLDMVMIPAQLALALRADGWYLRSMIVWEKPNPMPESLNGWRWEQHKVKVKNNGRGNEQWRANASERIQQDHDGREFAQDAEWQDCPGCEKCIPNDGLVLRKGSWRPTDSYEYLLMLTKSNSYFCDKEAVKEENSNGSIERFGITDEGQTRTWNTASNKRDGRTDGTKSNEGFRDYVPLGRNLRSVWRFPTAPSSLKHFAQFPPKLPLTCIKASTSEWGCCPVCGSQWARVVENKPSKFNVRVRDAMKGVATPEEGYAATQTEIDNYRPYGNHPPEGYTKTLGWRATCSHNKTPVPCTVLDPFSGVGTTLAVAKSLNRRAIGYEISEMYCELAREKIGQQQVML